jgi:hypothetical protein
MGVSLGSLQRCRCILDGVGLDSGGASSEAAPMALRGERHPLAKLTDQAAADIWSSPLPHRVLAERYGVSKSTFGWIKRGHHWKHVRPASTER